MLCNALCEGLSLFGVNIGFLEILRHDLDFLSQCGRTWNVSY